MKYYLLLSMSLILGGVHGRESMEYEEATAPLTPQKVSHRNTIVLGNGQFHDMWVSIGRPKSGYRSEDNFRKLLPAYKGIDKLHNDLFYFDQIKLFEGESKESFRSYVNSPTSKGGLSQRPSMKDSKKKWPQILEEFKSNPPEKLFTEGRFSEMSAAEKYDFLLGPQSFLFTREVEYSDSVFRTYGAIAYWAGICHGTAPASFLFPEPKSEVVVKGHDGRSIPFSTNDIKRLSAHAWAENNYDIAFIGGRCRSDELGSREPDCLDTNPATLHLALLNYIGLHGKTLIMDNAYDSDVWNRPIMGFSYKYVHPKTKVRSRLLKHALVKRSDYPDDPHKWNRRIGTHYIVEVHMKVKLLFGDEGDQGSGAKGYDIHYKYDLEIDQKGRIVGGEWITQYHPDFLWMVYEGSSPETSEDLSINENLWSGKTPLSSNVRRLGQQAAKKGNVLEHIVRSLLELSK